MRSDNFKNTMQKVHLSNEAKNRIKTVCRTEEMKNPHIGKSPRTWTLRGGALIAAVFACVVVLSISVYAAVELISFYMEREDDTAKIHAALNETVDTSTTPNRAWNANEDEVMVKLVFGYMPEDIKPDLTANGKYGGEENNRAMTFSGFDLRICDLNTVIGDTSKAEEFTAESNRAFLVTSGSEIAIYNKVLYVLFEDEQLVIKASVGFGISEEELKEIAAGLVVEETDDISLALPISNEVGLGGSSNIPDVLIFENPKIYRNDLLALGESVHYESEFHYDDITVERAEIFDSIAPLNMNLMNSFGLERIEDMTDAEGNFIPYNRTMVDNYAGKFGETEEVAKRLIVFTVKLKEVMKVDDADPYPLEFLQSFNLAKLVENEDGTIDGNYAPASAVIDRTPGTDAGTVEPIYREQIDEDTYRIAYIIDDDQLDGELILENRFAEIYYAIPVDSLIK